MENVFVAWSRNYELARCVADKLENMEFQVTVGGGSPKDMFIGSQIQQQMDSASYAIILAQKKTEFSGSAEFSDNVMFEWGYLISKLTSQKVFAYLIDTDERELPSDLVGSWVIPIKSENNDANEIAQQIVDQFKIEKRSVDKLEVMSRWREIKETLQNYGTQHKYSDFEIAQFVLYSLFSSYYYNDIPTFTKACSKIETTSENLRIVLLIAQLKMQIYEATSNLAKPLGIEDYFEISAMLSHEHESQIEESDLKCWARIIRLDAISLCNCLVIQDSIGDSEYYATEAIRLGTEVLDLIESDLALYPHNTHYANLIKGFQYRNIAGAYLELHNVDQAKEFFKQSVAAREKLYFYFKQTYSTEHTLCSKFAQEYYLSLLERCQYEDNPMEKKRIKLTVEKFLSSWEDDFSRQQSLLRLVKEAFSKID